MALRRTMVSLLFAVLITACGRGGPLDRAGPAPSPAAAPVSPQPSIFTPSPVAPRSPTAGASPDGGEKEGSEPEPKSEPKSGSIPCGTVAHGSTDRVQITTRFTCYDIGGSTGAQVQAQINRKGPKVGGSRRVAATRWRIRWTFSTQPEDERCSVAAVNVALRVDFIFPRWSEPAAASIAFRQQWFSLLGDVRTHEYHHKKIAVQTADGVDKALNRLGSYSACNEAERVANSTGRDVVKEGRERQDAFDRAQ